MAHPLSLIGNKHQAETRDVCPAGLRQLLTEQEGILCASVGAACATDVAGHLTCLLRDMQSHGHWQCCHAPVNQR